MLHIIFPDIFNSSSTTDIATSTVVTQLTNKSKVFCETIFSERNPEFSDIFGGMKYLGTVMPNVVEFEIFEQCNRTLYGITRLKEVEKGLEELGLRNVYESGRKWVKEVSQALQSGNNEFENRSGKVIYEKHSTLRNTSEALLQHQPKFH
uniref:PRELI/MSF1 domain-containing protein n=1 Tax=Elaeophora elaphi TaxID=1147741 RepID=A0A0R3RJL4_9BILA